LHVCVSAAQRAISFYPALPIPAPQPQAAILPGGDAVASGAAGDLATAAKAGDSQLKVGLPLRIAAKHVGMSMHCVVSQVNNF
jgi:hypothetical protein